MNVAIAKDKKRDQFTLAKDVPEAINALVGTGKYYNKHHVVEQAVRALAKAELNGKTKAGAK